MSHFSLKKIGNFWGRRIFHLGISHEAFVFTVLELIVYFFFLPCRLVLLSMDGNTQSTEPGPQSWILDYGTGDRVHECKLSMEKAPPSIDPIYPWFACNRHGAIKTLLAKLKLGVI